MSTTGPSSPSSKLTIALLLVIAIMAAAIGFLLASRSDVPAPIAPEVHEAQPFAAPAHAGPRRVATPMPGEIAPLPSDHAAERMTPDQQLDALSSYEAIFRADAPDPEWAAPTEQKLTEAAIDPAIEASSTPQDFRAECAGRMCKIHMQFETLMQANDWAELYVVGISDAVSLARISVIPNPSGGADLIIYGSREGSEALLASPSAR